MLWGIFSVLFSLYMTVGYWSCGVFFARHCMRVNAGLEEHWNFMDNIINVFPVIFLWPKYYKSNESWLLGREEW